MFRINYSSSNKECKQSCDEGMTSYMNSTDLFCNEYSTCNSSYPYKLINSSIKLCLS